MLRSVFIILLVLALNTSGDVFGEDTTVVEYGYVRVLAESPPGWRLTRSPEADPGPQYTCCLLDGDGLDAFEGLFCRVEGTLRGSTLTVGEIEIAPEGAYAQPILDDLDARGVDFHEDGTEQPAGGLSRDGTCPDGTTAVPLYLVAKNIIDGFVIEAWICRGCGCYWALRSGGFAGVIEWVGPFPLPDADYTPDSVKPGRVRVRKKARKKTLSIRRAKDDLPVYAWETFTPADIDLGPGITVLEVRRSNARRIKVRVEISVGAEAGMRDVSVKGDSAGDLLEVRARR